MRPEAVARRRIRVRGTVQGVGFRPFVHRSATSLGLTGWVLNDAHGVLAEAEGPAAALDAFEHSVREGPPLALVDDVEVVPLTAVGDEGFTIRATADTAGADVHVSADVAPCDACLAEMRDPQDRRFGYPFVNCTDCGPRFSIVRAVPYDRPATSMASFRMCAQCRDEYDDPTDRRFHAQPIACPLCGPVVTWSAGGAGTTAAGAVSAAAACLAAGGIVAVKGVGGYHLACDAADEGAVAQLRIRKHRPHQPFAVMASGLREAERLCLLDDAAREALRSPRRPVVLAPRRGALLAPSVAPGLQEVGVMLPSSPLHELLLSAVQRPLVMTSGNRHGDPVVHRDDEAVRGLGPLVDGILLHDREIHVRVDDSVVRSRTGRTPQVVRRARGWVPQPVRLPVEAAQPVLAVGGHLKSTVTIVRGSAAVVSQHLGDLDSWAATRGFEDAIAHLVALSGVRPAVVAHDLHPDFRSTAWARESGLPLVAVQHHHAHVASCLAEHGVTDRVLGIAFDGVGLGTDGTSWGGELLLADLAAFVRVAHLAPVALPGGDAAVAEPWRVALAWLSRALGPDVAAEHGRRWDPRWQAVLSLAMSGRAPETTSVGRLFDAVAAVLGVRTRVSYEGQAAIELEAAARTATGTGTRAYGFAVDDGCLDPAPMWAELLADRRGGVTVAESAAAFHRGLARATAELALRLAADAGVDTAALSGGVFANTLLSGLLADRLSAAGLRVLQHEQVPCNDGGLSLGQAAVAAAAGFRVH